MKKQYIRVALLVIFALVFIFSVSQVIWIQMGYHQAEDEYKEAGNIAGLPSFSQQPVSSQPPSSSVADPMESDPDAPESTAPVYVDPYADALRAMNFAALREVNSDVLGWILIPDTTISYPFLQRADNDYYLDHTWRRSYNTVGAIFMECTNSGDFSDFNTILYGHRMNNNSMFGVLHRYAQQSYWADHPYVYITDDSGSRRYDIFAAYEVSTSGNTYRISFSGTQAKQSFIDFCLAQSVIDTGVTPTVYDNILTLSTCTSSGHETRWVVQAVYRGEPPVQESEPPVQESDPPVQESDPPVQESEPPVQESEPPVQESEPPVQESDPPVQELGPPAQEPGDAAEY